MNGKSRSLKSEDGRKLAEAISYCMQQAINEDPENSKDWTPEELWEKGSIWAAKHIVISEEKEQ